MQIHQIKTRLVNSYVIAYPDCLLVVDVAIRCHDEVRHFIETELSRSVEDIALVICSHDDPDHIGGIEALADAAQAEVAIPYASNSTIKKLYNDPSAILVRLATSIREMARFRMWEMYFNPKRSLRAKRRRGPKRPPELQPRKQLSNHHLMKHGESVPGFEDWQVIHTPGHSWDSCCFYHKKSGSLLTGDTLLGSGKKGHIVKPSIYSNPLHMQKTLRHLKQLHITSVFPGHGSAIHGKDLFNHL